MKIEARYGSERSAAQQDWFELLVPWNAIEPVLQGPRVAVVRVTFDDRSWIEYKEAT